MNFTSVMALYNFVSAKVGKKWNMFSSEKVLQVRIIMRAPLTGRCHTPIYSAYLLTDWNFQLICPEARWHSSISSSGCRRIKRDRTYLQEFRRHDSLARLEAPDLLVGRLIQQVCTDTSSSGALKGQVVSLSDP